MIPLLLALFAGSAQAAPPSATLSGSDGTLAWTVSSSGGAVQIQGSSPKWKVQHTADANMRPRATTRTDPDGKVTKVTYEAGVVTVTLPGGKVVTHKGGDIWDGDTLDMRLAERVRKGMPLDVSFKAVDTGSGKLYSFDSVDKGAETCPTGPCRHVNVTLGGWLKYVGPSFDYWFASDGKLVKFEGPAGKFVGK